METGLNEWPLAIFTVLGQTVVGAIMVIVMVQIFASITDQKNQALHRSMFFLWLIMGLGFAISSTHLGSPFRAINALNRLGESALSNEAACGMLFCVVGGLGWLLSVVNKMPRLLGKCWLILTLLLGLLFVYSMTRVYMISTVPTWNNGYTTLNFFLTVFIAGPALGVLLLRLANVDSLIKGNLLLIVTMIATFVSMCSVFSQSNGFAYISTSVQQASTLVAHYNQWSLFRFALIVIGIICWAYPLIKYRSIPVFAMVISVIIIVFGEFIGRCLFYGLHMTVGVTVGG